MKTDVLSVFISNLIAFNERLDSSYYLNVLLDFAFIQNIQYIYKNHILFSREHIIILNLNFSFV